MFPVPIAFLNNELKAEIGMKMKKDEEENNAKFCSLKFLKTRSPRRTWSRFASRILEMVNDIQRADEEPWIRRQL
jgi:hypothetical protein